MATRNKLFLDRDIIDIALRRIHSWLIDKLENLEGINTIIFVPVMDGAYPLFSYLVQQFQAEDNYNIEYRSINCTAYKKDGVFDDVVIAGNLDFSAFENTMIVIVDDIYDTGRTADMIINKGNWGNNSLFFVSLLRRHLGCRKLDGWCITDKPNGLGDIEVYSPITVFTNKWFFGFGMDRQGKDRCLPEIYIVEEEV